MKNEISQFLEWHEATGKSDVSGYGYSLNIFRKYMVGLGVTEVTQLNAKHIDSWQLYQPKRLNRNGLPISPVSINNGFSRLRSFLRYLHTRGIILQPLADLLTNVKQPKLLPKALLNDQEISKLLDAFDQATPLGFRNRTIALTMYSSGCRVGELVSLNLEDINYEQETMLVYGKGRKERLIPVGSQAIRAIESYVRGIRSSHLKGKSTNALFISQRTGQRLSKCAIQTIFREVTNRCGFKGITPHAMRRSFATQMVIAGAKSEVPLNLVHLKDMLGHESFNQISKYVKLEAKDLVDSHRKYHPRG